MDRASLSNAVLSLEILVLCSFMLACGAPSDPPTAQVFVASTQNPLVAQVTVGSSCQGVGMVEFGPDTSYGRTTAWTPVPGHFQKTTILVAGMKASTTYHMRAQVQCDAKVGTSGDLTFATGPLPTVPFPVLQVSRPSPTPATPENPGVELLTLVVPNSSAIQSLVTDREGNPIWFYDVGANNTPFTVKPMPNGHVIISITRPDTSILREIDLAGNTVREMDGGTLGRKVAAAGFDFVPVGFHHEILPLANGHVIVLISCNKDFTDLPGYPGTTTVIGDGIIDLDENWDPVWAWNAFDYLDVNRHLAGLPDWTHGNALMYSPNDGNLLFSMRHQSWVIKIDYNNGAGTGNVLWKLGYQGDFQLAQGDDPSLWFAFQHFPSLISQNGTQTTLSIWDNGDFRVLDTQGNLCSLFTPPFCFSRATVFQVDESAMVANLQWADTPGLFSVWGGSINQLANGNIEFDLNAPAVPPAPEVASEIQEVTQTDTPEVVWKMDISPATMHAYRGYRIPSLYPDVTWDH